MKVGDRFIFINNHISPGIGEINVIDEKRCRIYFTYLEYSGYQFSRDFEYFKKYAIILTPLLEELL